MGEQGPMGPQGPQGESGVPSDLPGNVLATVHHVVVWEGGEDKDDARKFYSADDFKGDGARAEKIRDATMLVDGSLTFVASALAQDGSVVPVMFSWEVDDPVLASVEENDDGSGATIMGARRGNTKIILKAADRGIKIEIPLRVQNEVKGIVLRNDMDDMGAKGSDVTVNKGTNPQVTATAYDAKNEEDGTNEGNAVSGVKFTWTTSNSSVATVDTEDSNVSPIIKTHAAGSAEIQAKIGDVKSNKIKVTVFTTEEPERRLIVSTANAPFTRYYDTDLNDDQTADDPVLSASADTTDNTEANITITVTLQHRVLDTTAASDTFGELVWRVVADDAALDIAVSSSDTDVLTVPATIETGSGGAATLTINAGAAVTGNGRALKAGAVFVTFDETYSSAKRVKVEFKAKAGDGG